MGCVIVLFVLLLPRTIMVALWLFSSYLSTAFGCRMFEASEASSRNIFSNWSSSVSLGSSSTGR